MKTHIKSYYWACACGATCGHFYKTRAEAEENPPTKCTNRYCSDAMPYRTWKREALEPLPQFKVWEW